MIQPQGIITPLVTPMTSDNKINQEELRRQVNRLIQAGVHGLFPLGTNGEFYVLGEKEKLEVLRIVIDEANGRVPIYAGTGCIGTEETIQLSKKALKLGADALTIISPYFVAVTQEDLYYHFKKIAEETDFPLIIYNIQGRTSINLETSTLAELAKLKNIVGVKEASGSLSQMIDVIEKCPKEFSVLSGDDKLTLPLMACGGTGVVSVASNVIPKRMVDFVQNAFDL